jgi:hypothetical protein
MKIRAAGALQIQVGQQSFPALAAQFICKEVWNEMDTHYQHRFINIVGLRFPPTGSN